MSQPNITQIGQFLKDLSFENFPITEPLTALPAIELNVSVDSKPVGEPKVEHELASGEFDVTLTLRATARPVGKDGAMPKDNDKILFIAEISYFGRYAMQNVPEGDMEPFLLIEAPRLLFPFARQIIADAIMQGGQPPLLLAPVDFHSLYLARKQQQQKAS